MEKIKQFSLLILSFILFSSIAKAQLGRTFLTGLAQGAGEKLGGMIVEELFERSGYIRQNNVYALYPELREDMDDLKAKMSYLQYHIHDLNNRMSIAESRIEELEDWVPVGTFGFEGYFGNLENQKYSHINSAASIVINDIEFGLNLCLDKFEIPITYQLEREKLYFKNILPYARFGYEDDPAYLMFGPINTSGFGHAFMFRNFSNDIIYNNRQFGINTGIKHAIGGFEFMSNDITSNRLKTGRAFISPLVLLHTLADADAEYSLALTNIGYGYIKDQDINGKELLIETADFQIPIVMQADEYYHVFANLFGNFAKFNDLGSGYGIGASCEFNVSGFKVGGWYEYRNLEKQFSTGLFDAFYEIDRFNTNYSKYELIKQDFTKNIEKFYGLEVHLWALHFDGYYGKVSDLDVSNSIIETKNKDYCHLQGSVIIPIGNYVKFESTGSIDKRNISSLDDLDLKNFNTSKDVNTIFNFSNSLKINLEHFSIYGKISYRDYFYDKNENIGTPNFEKLNTAYSMIGICYNFGWDN